MYKVRRNKQEEKLDDGKNKEKGSRETASRNEAGKRLVSSFELKRKE